MRISDWSSDVCSSDLCNYTIYLHPTIGNIRLFDDRSPFTLRLRLRRSHHGQPARAYCPRFRTGQHPGSRPLSRLAGLKLGGAVQSSQEFQDRKSVVSGKSVEVRVDLGGLLIIKKKKKNKINK